MTCLHDTPVSNRAGIPPITEDDNVAVADGRGSIIRSTVRVTM